MKNLYSGAVDWERDDVKLMFVTTGYFPDQSRDEFRSDLGSSEASGGVGYLSEGHTIGNRVAVTEKIVRLKGDNVSLSIAGGPFVFRYGVIYKARGGVATADELVGFIDFGLQSIRDAVIDVDFDAIEGIARYPVLR